MDLKVNMEWMEEESDHRPCELCGEMMIGKMWTLVTFVNNEPANLETSKKYCTACYMEPAEEE